MTKKTIQLTKAQEKALIWAINIWEASYEGSDFEHDKEMTTKIRAARVALTNVYDHLED
jgi:hypothetical protein